MIAILPRPLVGKESSLTGLKVRRTLLTAIVVLSSILIFFTMTGMTWGNHTPLANRPVLNLPADVQVTLTTTPTVTPVPVVPGQPDEMVGIILAGTILVLIVLGGTIGATRRKKS